MNRPTGCPVPREASDSEKILKWLGYKPYNGLWVKKDAWKQASPQYALVISADQERLFLPGEHPADPYLDYLALEKVRTLGEEKGWEIVIPFMENLEDLWERRSAPSLLAYLPGDYAEAARFLWEDA